MRVMIKVQAASNAYMADLNVNEEDRDVIL